MALSAYPWTATTTTETEIEINASAVTLSDGHVVLIQQNSAAPSVFSLCGNPGNRRTEVRNAATVTNAALRNRSAHVQTRFGAFTAGGRRRRYTGCGAALFRCGRAGYAVAVFLLRARSARSNQRNFAACRRTSFTERASVGVRPSVPFVAIHRRSAAAAATSTATAAAAADYTVLHKKRGRL